MQLPHKLPQLVLGIPHRIRREIELVVHVIDITPNRLQRDARGAVVGDDLLDVRQVGPAVFTLVKAQRPVRHHGGQPDDGGILLTYVLGSRAGEEVEIDNPADGVILEVLLPCIALADDDVHACCIP